MPFFSTPILDVHLLIATACASVHSYRSSMWVLNQSTEYLRSVTTLRPATVPSYQPPLKVRLDLT